MQFNKIHKGKDAKFKTKGDFSSHMRTIAGPMNSNTDEFLKVDVYSAPMHKANESLSLKLMSPRFTDDKQQSPVKRSICGNVDLWNKKSDEIQQI